MAATSAAAAATLIKSISAVASIGRFHICCIGAFGSLLFGHLLLDHYQPLLAVLVLHDWFLINILNRVSDLREDIKNNIPFSQFAYDHRRAILATYMISLSASFSLHFVLPTQFPQALLVARVIGNSLGLIYNFRPFFLSQRLKELYFFKNVSSCMGFLITSFLYPLCVGKPLYGKADESLELYLALLNGFFSLFEISFEIIYDLRDEKGDREAGIQTYPVVHGREISEAIVVILNIFSVVFLLIGAEIGLFTGRETIMIHAPLIQLLIFWKASKNGYPSRYFVI